MRKSEEFNKSWQSHHRNWYQRVLCHFNIVTLFQKLLPVIRTPRKYQRSMLAICLIGSNLSSNIFWAICCTFHNRLGLIIPVNWNMDNEVKHTNYSTFSDKGFLIENRTGFSWGVEMSKYSKKNRGNQ